MIEVGPAIWSMARGLSDFDLAGNEVPMHLRASLL